MDTRLLKKRVIRVLVVILVIILSLKTLSWVCHRMDPGVRQLPQNACEVKIRTVWFPGDILFIVKAKMGEGDFHQYVKNLGFEPLPDRFRENNCLLTDIYDGIISKRHIGWWDPSYGNNENTYYDPQSKSSWGVMLKYENGHSYYMETTLFGWDDK